MKISKNPQKSAEKSCKTCEFCKQFYRLFGYHMSAVDRFFCEVSNAFTESTSTCPVWQKKVKDAPDFSSERFDKAEAEIKDISEILNRNLSMI